MGKNHFKFPRNQGRRAKPDRTSNKTLPHGHGDYVLEINLVSILLRSE